MNKLWYKERIFGYECRAVQIINEGMPKRETLKKLKSELNKLDLDSIEKHSLWNFSIQLYKKMRRNEPLQNTFRAMQHEKNQVADNIEFRIKHNQAMDMINSSNVFYQCDSHPNCADGHLKYEGQIFINEDAASESELQFAATHGIKPLRQVMFGEDYLLTRRNCKHRLLPVTSSAVMEGKVPDAPVIYEKPGGGAYRAYYDRRKFLTAAGISKKNDSYKRTVYLIKKHKL